MSIFRSTIKRNAGGAINLASRTMSPGRKVSAAVSGSGLGIVFSLFLSAAVLLEPLPVEAETLVVNDKLNRAVSFEVPCRRVVLFESYELLPVTGAWDKVAGLSRHAFENDLMFKANPGLKSIPNAGSALEANLEHLLSLETDLVITWPHKAGNREIGFWEDKGLKAIIVYPKTLGDLYDLMWLHAEIFDAKPQITKAVTEMEAIFTLIKSRLDGLENRKKAFWLFSKPNNIAGRQGVPQLLFDLIKIENQAPENSDKNVEISLESMYAGDPDILFIWGFSPYTADDLMRNKQWEEIAAVKNGQVYKVPPWSTFSPRLAPLALIMASEAYPERFADVDIEEIVDNFYGAVYGLKAGEK